MNVSTVLVKYSPEKIEYAAFLGVRKLGQVSISSEGVSHNLDDVVVADTLKSLLDLERAHRGRLTAKYKRIQSSRVFKVRMEQSRRRSKEIMAEYRHVVEAMI